LLAQSNWDDAEAQAVQLGGHLVTINSQAEQDWVFQTFGAFGGNTNRALWVGLRKSSSGVWVWSSGEPVTYTHWAPGQPSDASDAGEDAVTMDAFRWDPPGQWNDFPHSGTSAEWFGLQITYHGVVEVVPHHDWIKWPLSEGGNDHFFALTVSAYTNWFDAEAEGKSLDGHLASINSAGEQLFVEKAFLSGITRSNALWIGLNDLVSDGTFVWSSGEAATYLNWESGQPNECCGGQDAVTINFNFSHGAGDYAKWNDQAVLTSAGVAYYGIIEAASVATTFTKITGGPVVTDGGDSRGGAWGDFNGDGFEDLFVPNVSDGEDFVYQNNGDGTFARLAFSAAFNDSALSSSECAVWGDYDNDGHLDLFIAEIELRPERHNRLFRGNGDGTFVKVTSSVFDLDRAGSGRASWVDFDHDGFLDLFVANNGGQPGMETEANSLYRNNGDGTFRKITTGSIVTDLGPCSAAVWGDYDNDGHVDLFVTDQRAGYPNRLYRNNGDGTFTKITDGPVVTDQAGSWGCAWGDYDNDGYLDLFVASLQGCNLYRNNGDGTFTRTTGASLVGVAQGYGTCAWGDYDNDGFLDLFVAGWGNATNLLYHNNGDGTFTKIASGSIISDGGNAWGCSWADYDKDGDLDLFVANSFGKNNNLYR